jgi:FHA domain-containing protein
MLKLEVISYKGIAPQRPISAEFDKVGGSVGRGDINALILPDADRYISRMHARISYRSGRYFVEDHGTATPVIVNGRTLGKGIDAPLEHGAEIKIGDYRLRAMVQEPLAPLVPLAAASATFPGASTLPGSPKADDPLAAFGASSAADPFADLVPTPKSTARPPDILASKPIANPFDVSQVGRGGKGIPADFDPFANLGRQSASAPAKGASSGAAELGIGALPESQSIDALFGLGQASGSDPLAATRSLPESSDVIAFGTTPSLDPMAQFQSKAPNQPTTSQRNDVPELHGSFVPPRVAAEVAKEKHAVAVVRSEPAAPPYTPPDMPPKPDVPVAAPVVPLTQNQTVKATPEDPLLETRRFTRENVQQEATVRAFLDGAGVADLDLPAGLTPQTMFMMGQVLRETVQAMLDLLLARAMLKRELRADVTMILAKENNPLKFSPNVEAALAHLLNPQRGYKQPLEAVKDACNDLRSHQFAFMSGMRAALEGILHRFNPEQLEKRLKQKTVLDSVLPINRKAKMWDQFSDLYGDMSKEAEEDFHALFGREFLRAYEAQIDKLTRQDAAAKRT